jgi:hypothetical protein
VVLRAGGVLNAGESVTSADGQYRLTMTPGGALAEESGAAVLWSSRTAVRTSRAVMQIDGNLVVYSPSGAAQWASGTAGHPGAQLSVPYDGEVAVVSDSGARLWSTGASNSTLSPGQPLAAGWSITSANGDFRLVMQADGNLVEYRSDDAVAWDSATSGPGARTIMQADGNLVIYTASGAPIWQSRTSGEAGAVLSLRDDGDVVIVRGGSTIWSNGTIRNAIVAAAASQIGVQDSPAGTYCNKYSAYWGSGALCGNGNRSEGWCADFAAWSWRMAGVPFVYGSSPGDVNAMTASFYQWAVDHGAWHAAGSGYVPQPGDVAVFGLSASGTYADHVAVVVSPGQVGVDAINGDWWSTGNGGVEPEDNETSATGTDGLSGYASPYPAGSSALIADARLVSQPDVVGPHAVRPGLQDWHPGASRG